MRLTAFDFGVTSDQSPVRGFRAENGSGISIAVINWGATLISVKTPDKKGISEEITLGFPGFEDYERHSPYFGSSVGRVANRIAHGRFIVDGIDYQVAKNENNRHHLHGGSKGLSKVLWDIEPVIKPDSLAVVCTYLSPDGEEGYPGNLHVKAVYTLTGQNLLTIEYEAAVDRTCPVNLTQHAYWNLSGGNRRPITVHRLQLDCDYYLPVNSELIPTGEIRPVAGTPWDFKNNKEIGTDLGLAGGYDHCFVQRFDRGPCQPIAQVHEPESGRQMQISTTEPAIQFYSGNFLDRIRKQGFNQYDGFCLETQSFPDALHHDHFPSILLLPERVYRQRTEYRFNIK
jgi:aldose 1-epimerase